MQEPGLPPTVILDLELLARLRPDSPRADWERTLRRTGLLQLRPTDTPAGQLIARLQQQFAAWTGAPARKSMQVRPMDPRTLQGMGAVGGALLVIGLLQDTALWRLGALLLGLTVGLVLFTHYRNQNTDVSNYSNEMYSTLKKLMEYSFIEPMGNTVIEATPHRDLILLRIDQLRQADRRIRSHVEELEATRIKILELNKKIGTSIEDAETLQISRIVGEQLEVLERIQRLHRRLTERLAEVDQRLERRRTLATRMALSAQAGRLVEVETKATGAEAGAEAEIDLLSIEQDIRQLALDEVQDELRLRALIEVSSLRG
jgi:hypothetical protein